MYIVVRAKLHLIDQIEFRDNLKFSKFRIHLNTKLKWKVLRVARDATQSYNVLFKRRYIISPSKSPPKLEETVKWQTNQINVFWWVFVPFFHRYDYVFVNTTSNRHILNSQNHMLV